ncbi:chromate efflux transporter [Glutamicibacter sp.]|uniref:chromate efflux transporter n=1 Tax=Glutamicibacter sp. TaxID=1931995 RepID=UPI0028BEFEB4|nr:chromate efflux transporter [Glutamicibacter sp.]
MEKQHSPAKALEVFRVFLKLGVTSFGGPIAHLSYFRDEAVQRRRWLNDQQYADLVALCQFLPGPASSQVGFGIGLYRAGLRGAIAAFLGFTLPSAVLMVLFAYGASAFSGTMGQGMLQGLKIVAVAVVAQAVLGMAKTLTPDARRASIAAAAAVAVLLIAGTIGQVLAILFGAIAGYFWCRDSQTAATPGLSFPVGKKFGIGCLTAFALLLFGLPILAAVGNFAYLEFFDAFYRSGSLVFGGGHVVLPLLQSAVVEPGWVTDQQFLAGYGAAQAVPGPLFTFAAYLGAVSTGGAGSVLGAAIALIGIFLPGFLLLLGVLPFWNSLSKRPAAQAVMRGAGAAVVGILASALYSPVFTSAILGPKEFALALVCFVLLISWKLPPWIVVVVGALGGVGLAFIG